MIRSANSKGGWTIRGNQGEDQYVVAAPLLPTNSFFVVDRHRVLPPLKNGGVVAVAARASRQGVILRWRRTFGGFRRVRRPIKKWWGVTFGVVVVSGVLWRVSRRVDPAARAEG